MARFRDEDVRMALNIIMCSQGRLFATPITGTSNKFRPRQRRLRGPTHGKWEESLLQHSSRRFQLAAESKVVHCRYSKSPNRTDERPGTGSDFLSDVHFSDFVTEKRTFDVLRVRDERTIWRSCIV